MNLDQELQASAINAEIANLNFLEIAPTDGQNISRAYEYLLYAVPDNWFKKNGHLRAEYQRKYNHLDHGGWWCSTLNPDGSRSDWGCLKPSNPRTVTDGDKEKVIKYETPPNTPARPFLLKVGIETWGRISETVGIYDGSDFEREGENPVSFWECLRDEADIPIIITEGAKKAASLLSAGYPAIALNGIWGAVRNPADDVTGEKTGEHYLIPEIEYFCQPGREFVFCFDNDAKEKTRIAVNSAIKITGQLIHQRTGAAVSVMTWGGSLKGIDDVHAKYGQRAVSDFFKKRKVRAWAKPDPAPAPKPEPNEEGDRPIGEDENERYRQKLMAAEAILKENDPDAYAEVMGRMEKVETTAPLKPHRPETRRIHGGYKNLCYAELFEFLEENLGGRLQFDLMRREMLLDGQLFQLADELKPWFYKEFGETANEKDIYTAMVFLAKKNSFDPVVLDLERCHRTAPRVRIDNLAARYFGHDWESMPESTDEEIREKRFAWMYNRCLEMWLISAVARQFETRDKEGDPTYLGCQADHVLVLQGGEGKGKSTWFKRLSQHYFNDSISDIQATNSLMAMHGNWIIELAEIDGITSKKDSATLKHYLTVRQDEFRAPYERKTIKHNRRSVFCGTVNPSRFLLEGENRRFWCVPVKGDIDLDLIEKERDGIWAAAVDAYLAGARWYPNAEETGILRAIALEFAEMDPWHDMIESFMAFRTHGNANEILVNLLEYQVKDIGRREQMRVTRILSQLGFTEEKRIRWEGKYIRVRVKPQSQNSENNKKVGNVGQTPITDTLPSEPTLIPTSEGVGSNAVTNGEPLNQPNLSGVGSPETQSPQALQSSDTNLPTKTAFSETATPPEKVPDFYAARGVKFAVNQILQQESTDKVVMVLDYPAPGVEFLEKIYTCQYLDDQAIAKIPQSDLIEV